MSKQPERLACPDCDADVSALARRDFLRTAGVAAAVGAVGAAASAWPAWATAKETPGVAAKPESVVKLLYESLSDSQKHSVCFDWDHEEKARALLRTRVSNNWQITPTTINSAFFTKDQQQMIRHVYEGIIHPDWHERIDKQLKDDAGGYGQHQSIAIFGHPGVDKFEFVMTGRHMTIRCDGHSAEHVAFGGPIFYGHAAGGFNEKADHPGNVFWPRRWPPTKSMRCSTSDIASSRWWKNCRARRPSDSTARMALIRACR